MNVSDKLTKVTDSFTINMYDNGYMIEISGKDHDVNGNLPKYFVKI